MKCDVDIRKDLYSKLLSGGTTFQPIMKSDVDIRVDLYSNVGFLVATHSSP